MASWSLRYTTVLAALKTDPQLSVCRPTPPTLVARLMRLLHRSCIGAKGFLPPGFRQTMGAIDARLPEMTQGVGVVEGGRARFYPTSTLADGLLEDWAGRTLKLGVGSLDKVPYAEWKDGERPMQIFSRWYGFAFSFPGCELYLPD